MYASDQLEATRALFAASDLDYDKVRRVSDHGMHGSVEYCLAHKLRNAASRYVRNRAKLLDDLQHWQEKMAEIAKNVEAHNPDDSVLHSSFTEVAALQATVTANKLAFLALAQVALLIEWPEA